MKFSRLYVLVLIFFISFSTSIFADEIEENKIDKVTVSEQENIENVATDIDYNDERVMLEKKKKALENEIAILSRKDPRVNFFYLIGGVGYTCSNSFSNYEDECLDLISGDYRNGFTVSAIGGWQARKYFAMELGIDYTNTYFQSMGVRYALLFQPYLKIDRSWSIMPKVGLGFSLIRMFADGEMSDTPMQGGFAYDLHGVLGLRANYKKLIFGVSYKHNFVSPAESYSILAEAGVKF